MKFQTNEVLFVEGERSRQIFRLIHGEAEVIRKRGNDFELLGSIRTGELVGEVGVLTGSRRSGTLRFTAPSEVEVLSRRQFIASLDTNPELAVRLIHVLSLRARASLEFLRRQGIEEIGLRARIRRWVRKQFYLAYLKSCSDEIHNAVGAVSRHFKKGETLFTEGEQGDYVLWLERGLVRLEQSRHGEQKIVAHVGRHEFLGEMGVLESLPRTAKAVAQTDVVATYLSPVVFFEHLKKSPRIRNAMIRLLSERVHSMQSEIRSAEASGRPMADSDLFRVVESVAQLSHHQIADQAIVARDFLVNQAEHGKFIKEAYQKYLRGDASQEEMAQANEYLRDYLKIAGLAALVVLPGTPITIPLAAKIGKLFGVDIFPKN